MLRAARDARTSADATSVLTVFVPATLHSTAMHHRDGSKESISVSPGEISAVGQLLQTSVATQQTAHLLPKLWLVGAVWKATEDECAGIEVLLSTAFACRVGGR